MTQVEYARCVLMIVKNEETSANIEEAARILQDVQVETYGSMDHREKVEFILYQMAIMIKKQDIIRLLIVSRKVTEKTFKGLNIEDLRCLYYSFLSIYERHEQNYFKSSNCMKQILDILIKCPNEISKLPAHNEFGFQFDIENLFKNFIFYTVISEYSKERQALLQEIHSKYITQLEKNEVLLKLVSGLLSRELINSSTDYWEVSKVEIFQPGFLHSEQHLASLRRQLIQHNIIVCSKNYERVRLARLAQLFAVSQTELEEELCNVINSDIIVGKIDRVEGVISFRRQRLDDDILDDWVGDVNKLLDLVNHTSNLIDREEDSSVN